MVTVEGKIPMAKRVRASKKKARRPARVRITISFPPDMHDTLEQIASEKKVSLAWVVREAVDTYLGEKWPLFKQSS